MERKNMRGANGNYRLADSDNFTVDTNCAAVSTTTSYSKHSKTIRENGTKRSSKYADVTVPPNSMTNHQEDDWQCDTKPTNQESSDNEPLRPSSSAPLRGIDLLPKTQRRSFTSRTKCIPPDTRRRMEKRGSLNDHTVISSPAVLDCPEENMSVVSAPIVKKFGASQRQAKSCRNLMASSEKPLLNQQQQQQQQQVTESSKQQPYSHSRYSSRHTSPPRRRNVRPMLGRAQSERNVYERVDENGTIVSGRTLDSQQMLRRTKSELMKSSVKIPEGDVTIVITDIQGSTSMWEANPHAMKSALALHDIVIRKCYSTHNGYEIFTEGDSFHLVFQHPIDAFSFCLQAQMDLYTADWPAPILALEHAALDEHLAFRGFRVRMGLHHGPTKSVLHEVTQRTTFTGETVNLAKALSHMCHGGQILTSVETWRTVSGMAERYLGSPQVLDCGEHGLEVTPSSSSSKTSEDGNLLLKRIVQLVPKAFAFDYFSWRGIPREERGERPIGRRFLRIKSKHQSSPEFFHAPYKNSYVTLGFLQTLDLLPNLTDSARDNNFSMLAKLIRSLLSRSDVQGYECQEENGSWMLAFHSDVTAISFGIETIHRIKGAPVAIKMGIYSGKFTSLGPHAVTGRADYFGPVVNRAARVMSSCDQNQVLLGMMMEDGAKLKLPDVEGADLHYLRQEQFNGVNQNIAIFSCTRSSSQTHRK